MDPIVIPFPRRVALSTALFGLLLTAMGLLVMLLPFQGDTEPRVGIGWVYTPLFALFTLWCFYRAWRSHPPVVLSNEGIFDPRLRTGPVAWSEVEGAYARRLLGKTFVCFRLRHADSTLGQVPPWRRELLRINRGFGVAEWMVPVSGTGVDAAAVVAAVERQVALRRGAA